MDMISNLTEYKIHKTVRLIELFGGIGAQAMALERLGVPMEHYRMVEYDKYPVKSYNAIHGTNFEPMDITKIHGWDLGVTEKDKYTYLLTYSFPCQDLSVAGKGRGMKKGDQTRSGLLWEVERLLDESPLLPDVLIMENVPQVHSTKNMEDFQSWLDYLSSKGYSNHYQDLNAADYGIPQSRKRCFCVSILGNYDFKFPKPIELPFKMVDFLEDEVEEKYYITTDKAKILIDKLIKGGKILTDRQTDRRTDRQLISPSRDSLMSSKQQTVSQQEKIGELPMFQTKATESVRSVGFIEKGTGAHQSNQVIDSQGTSSTLSATDYKHPILVTECKKL